MLLTRHRTSFTRSILISTAVVLLGACAVGDRTNAPETGLSHDTHAASTEEQRFNAEVERIGERIGERMRAACVSPKYKPYFAKTACLPAGITDVMMRDRTKITAAQKKAAQDVFDLTHTLSEEMRSFMISTGQPDLIEQAEASRREVDPLIENLQKALLAGRITWGEYNTQRRTLWLRESGEEAKTQEEVTRN